MGLDMYLQGRFKALYGTDKSKCGRKTLGDMFPEIGCEVSYVVFELGYWRKANAIHNWFVENCQDGIGECQESEVTKEHLLSLKEECLGYLNGTSDGPEPVGGFFFGSTERDEGYKQDMEDTVRICDVALNAIENGCDIIYQSSW